MALDWLNFKSNAAWVAVLICLSISAVLSTLPNPTLEALMPEATFTSVMAPVAIFELVIALLTTIGASAVPPKSPDNWMIPFLAASASTTDDPPPPPPTAILLST